MIEIKLKTKTQFEIVDLTDEVKKAIKKNKLKQGVVVVFTPHTTGAVRINHNEPLLKQDIMKMLYRTAPVDINYSHDFFEIRNNLAADERTNGHAHVKAFLLGASEAVPVENGEMQMGDRQSIFFVELDGGRDRKIFIQTISS